VAVEQGAGEWDPWTRRYCSDPVIHSAVKLDDLEAFLEQLELIEESHEGWSAIPTEDLEPLPGKDLYEDPRLAPFPQAHDVPSAWQDEAGDLYCDPCHVAHDLGRRRYMLSEISTWEGQPTKCDYCGTQLTDLPTAPDHPTSQGDETPGLQESLVGPSAGSSIDLDVVKINSDEGK